MYMFVMKDDEFDLLIKNITLDEESGDLIIDYDLCDKKNDIVYTEGTEHPEEFVDKIKILMEKFINEVLAERLAQFAEDKSKSEEIEVEEESTSN